jgi:hypothetical protein
LKNAAVILNPTIHCKTFLGMLSGGNTQGGKMRKDRSQGYG